MTSNNNSNVVGQLLLGLMLACGFAFLSFILILRFIDNNYSNKLWEGCTASVTQDKESDKIVVSGRLLTYRGAKITLPEDFEFQKKCQHGVGSVLFDGPEISSDKLIFTADGQVTIKPGKNEIVIVWDNKSKKPTIFAGHVTTNMIIDGHVTIKLPTKSFWQFW